MSAYGVEAGGVHDAAQDDSDDDGVIGLCRPVDYADRGVKVLVSEERWGE